MVEWEKRQFLEEFLLYWMDSPQKRETGKMGNREEDDRGHRLHLNLGWVHFHCQSS